MWLPLYCRLTVAVLTRVSYILFTSPRSIYGSGSYGKGNNLLTNFKSPTLFPPLVAPSLLSGRLRHDLVSLSDPPEYV